MNLEARFHAKKPEQISDVERLTITIGEFEIELVEVGTDRKPVLQIRLDGPLGDSLAVFPRASNTILIAPRRP